MSFNSSVMNTNTPELRKTANWNTSANRHL